MNSVDLALESRAASEIPYKETSGHDQLASELAEKQVLIDSLEFQLQLLQAKAANLEDEVQRWKSSVQEPEWSCSSSPNTSLESKSSGSSSIKEIKNSPSFGSTTKIRKVKQKSREVMASLSDVSERYGESIACVLGNCFIFRGETEKSEVSDLISEVVDLVIWPVGRGGAMGAPAPPCRLPRSTFLLNKINSKKK